MSRLLLVRHGKTDWNIEKKLQGRADIPLNDLGRELLLPCKIPSAFAKFRVVSSPLRRALETAEILTGETPQIAPELIEMDWGNWEGQTIAKLRSQSPDSMMRIEARGLDMCPPAGESPRDVQTRLRPWLRSLTGDTLGVSHKGVIRAVISLAFDWDMTGKPPARFDWTAGHLFAVNEQGRISPIEMNIPLEKI